METSIYLSSIYYLQSYYRNNQCHIRKNAEVGKFVSIGMERRASNVSHALEEQVSDNITTFSKFEMGHLVNKSWVAPKIMAIN